MKGGRIGQSLAAHQALQSCQPVVIITGAIVRLATIGGGLKFGRQRVRPLSPREVGLRGEAHRQCEGLGLPGFSEYRPAFVTRQLR